MPQIITTNTIATGVPIALGAIANEAVIVTAGVVVASTSNGVSAITGSGLDQGVFVSGYVTARDTQAIRLIGADATISVSSTGIVEGTESRDDSSAAAVIFMEGGAR